VKILVLHGPNLNLLGTREPGVYGRTTLAQVDAMLRDHARRGGHRVECRQSNHEGQLVDWLQTAQREGFAGIVFNPGAFTHYSFALRDAGRGDRPAGRRGASLERARARGVPAPLGDRRGRARTDLGIRPAQLSAGLRRAHGGFAPADSTTVNRHRPRGV
jgi:hypothetical protein